MSILQGIPSCLISKRLRCGSFGSTPSCSGLIPGLSIAAVVLALLVIAAAGERSTGNGANPAPRVVRLADAPSPDLCRPATASAGTAGFVPLRLKAGRRHGNINRRWLAVPGVCRGIKLARLVHAREGIERNVHECRDQSEIKPYRISVGDDVLDDLKSRLRRHALAGGRTGRRLEPGRAAEVDQGGLPLLGRGLRLARARGAAQSLCAVHHRDRRARHSFPARPLAASRRRCR